MITNCVYVEVKPEYIEAFIQATHANHLTSVQEAGNFRFDELQEPDQPTHFILYETYTDESAAIKHKETQHYKIWRKTVEKMMARPRFSIKYRMLFPQNCQYHAIV